MRPMLPMNSWAPAGFVLRKRMSQAPQPLVSSQLPVSSEPPAPAFSFTGIMPEDLNKSVMVSLAGAGVAALSTLLPDTAKAVGVVTGVLIAGIGIYKVYSSFADPKIEVCEVPQQATRDLSRVQGEFLAPVDKGSVELSRLWSLLWNSNRTYAIKFRIVNNSDQDLVIPVQVKVSEHPTLGDDKVSPANFCVSVPAHSQRIVDGYMPIFSDMTLGISCVGQLILKYPTATGANDRILQVIQFSI